MNLKLQEEKFLRLKIAVKRMKRLGYVKTKWRNLKLVDSKKKAGARVIALAVELVSE